MTHGGGEREGLSEDGVEEDEARERAGNEMAFTIERLRRLGVEIPTEQEREQECERMRQYALSEEARIIARRNEIDPKMMTARLVFYDEIQPPSESERIQYLMDITRMSPPPERQEEAEEESEGEEEEESEQEDEDEDEDEEQQHGCSVF